MILVSKTCRNLTISFSSMGESRRRLIPAFYHQHPFHTTALIVLELTLNNKSSRPYFSLTTLKILSTSSSLPISPVWISMMVPSLQASPVFFNSSFRLPTRNSTRGWECSSLGKALERVIAHDLPIPADAPVIKITRWDIVVIVS
jgi:hypothetical protein